MKMGDYVDWEFGCSLTVIILVGIVVLFLFLAGGSGAVGQLFEWLAHFF
jgi:hypothetical protein